MILKGTFRVKTNLREPVRPPSKVRFGYDTITRSSGRYVTGLCDLKRWRDFSWHWMMLVRAMERAEFRRSR